MVVAGLGPATAVHMHVRVEWPAGQPSLARTAPAVATTIEAQSTDGDGPANHVSQLVANDSAELDLPVGSMWRVTVSSGPDVVSETRAVGAESPGERDVVIRVWPARTLSGRLVLDGHVPAKVPSMDLRFQIPASSAEGETGCRLDRDQFLCSVPAVPVDYAFHVHGYAPAYRWSESSAAGKTRNVGTVSLRSGASILGRVIPGPDLPVGSLKNVAVTLAPINLSPRAHEDEPSRRVLARTGKPAGNGMFQFDGVEPGDYYVAASGQKVSSDTQRVRVIAKYEAQLRHPLVLLRPRSLTIRISPPVHPSGDPWTVKLFSINKDAQERTLSRASAAGKDGVWAATELSSGNYLVSLERGTHEKWLTQQVVVEDDQNLSLRLPLQMVTGTVTIGPNHPVSHATIWFGGDRGAVSIPVPSRSDGTFRTILPEPTDNRWNEIDVVSDKPPIRRVLRDVLLDTHDGDATLRISLPDGSVWGEVFSSDGKLLPGAYVLASSSDSAGEIAEVRADESGAYRLTALSPGRVILRARSGSLSSAATAVDVDSTATETGPYVALTITDAVKVSGTVRAFGTPIAGARVVVIPFDRRNVIVVPTTTDGAGHFETDLAGDTGPFSLAVAAPGFAFRFFQFAPSSDGTIDVDLRQDGGTLNVKLPQVNGAVVCLVHAGTYLPLGSITAFSGTSRPAGDRVAITDIEAGAYSLCAYQVAQTVQGLPKQCFAEGTLAPNGTLELEARSP